MMFKGRASLTKHSPEDPETSTAAHYRLAQLVGPLVSGTVINKKIVLKAGERISK